MYTVLFEVRPHGDRWDDYLNYAGMLRPELQDIEGFIDNIRYRSLRRPGWLLSLSTWETEKALIRWRTHAQHHEVQTKGRQEILGDYRLRVGRVSADTDPPNGRHVVPREVERTEVGDASSVILVDGRRTPDLVRNTTPEQVAVSLHVDVHAPDLVSWEVFEAVLSPGDVIAMLGHREPANSRQMPHAHDPASGTRYREIDIIRDYGMRARAESPQYFPAAGPALES
jgi:heme-degrading monooxygenase HmoA